jgi:hypothetical protein
MTSKEESRRFESVTLGLPPLKMILVETDAETRKGPPRKATDPLKTHKKSDNRQAILKLINHLTGTDR